MDKKPLEYSIKQICKDLKMCVYEEDRIEWIKKYDMSLASDLKSKIWYIESVQLPHALSFAFNLHISHDELMRELKAICKELDVELKPMIDADSSHQCTASAYRIVIR